MATILFDFYHEITSIECKKEDFIKDICIIFASKIGYDIKTLFFLHNGERLNLDLNLTFDDEANSIDKDSNIMTFLVYQSSNSINPFKNELQKSKDIICPECSDNCRINIRNFKIKFYGCKNKHRINNILLDEFNNTQLINNSLIKCNICNQNNKKDILNNQFFQCLTCNKSICIFCNSKHDKNHKIIDYDKKNYICKKHNNKYTSYCNECKINICNQGENEHESHRVVNFKNIMENKNEIMKAMVNFKQKIDILKNNINEIINMLNKVSQNLEIYYSINNEIINNYKDYSDINYCILQNINDIKDNIHDLDDIITNNNIYKQFKTILNIYNKMNDKSFSHNILNEKREEIIVKKSQINDINSEITINYKIDKNESKINLFGYYFVKNNEKKM